MIRHVVLFGFRDGVEQPQIDAAIARLDALPNAIAEVRAWAIHEDVGHRAGSVRFALVAEFDTLADVDTYLAHPAHVAAVNDALPLMATVLEHDHEIG